ncbi:hypothetical protein ACFOOP_08925 [Marinicaulis aureus]|uniref:Uncharacterized protein n=1 Tax=Hyphococcus aureus TaxID=2666033 RepID=A0ABW1KU86_9PROT
MRIERRYEIVREARAVEESLEEMTRAVIRSAPVCAHDCTRA